MNNKTPHSLDGGNYIHGLDFFFLKQYESIHVIDCVEVEHGRNQLIIGQWCEPLTSVRETTNNENGSQSTQYDP